MTLRLPGIVLLVGLSMATTLPATAQGISSSAHSVSGPIEHGRLWSELELAMGELAGDLPVSYVDTLSPERLKSLTCKERVHIAMMRRGTANQRNRQALQDNLELLFRLRASGYSAAQVEQQIQDAANSGPPAKPDVLELSNDIKTNRARMDASKRQIAVEEEALEQIAECLPPGNTQIRTSELAPDLRRINEGGILARDFMREFTGPAKSLKEEYQFVAVPKIPIRNTLSIIAMLPPKSRPTSAVPLCVERNAEIVALYQIAPSGQLSKSSTSGPVTPTTSAPGGSACNRHLATLQLPTR